MHPLFVIMSWITLGLLAGAGSARYFRSPYSLNVVLGIVGALTAGVLPLIWTSDIGILGNPNILALTLVLALSNSLVLLFVWNLRHKRRLGR